MSSRVRQKIRSSIVNKMEIQENRESFSYRFCDELCEEILQYLPIEDKLKLECLSQQIQRTIYRRQTKLKLPNYLMEFFQTNGTVFHFLLKKCPNVREIDFTDILKKWLCQGYYVNEYNYTMDLIIRYCHHLTRIYITFSSLWPKTNQNFIEKFGSKLLSIDSSNDCYLSNAMIDSFESLKELHLKENRQNLWYFLLKPKRLEKLVVKGSDDQSGLADFIARNQSLKYLSIECINKDILQTVPLLSEISKLKKLVVFRFEGNYELNNELFGTQLYEMAITCRQLKSIKCKVVSYSPKHSDIEVISALSKFRGLQRLEIAFTIKEVTFPNVNKIFTIEMFNGFKNLTHLILGINMCQNASGYYNNYNTFFIDEIMLTDIGKYLPKLQYLEIRPQMIAKLTIVDTLSQLLSLETIKLQVRDEFIRRPIVEKLIKKCRKIRYINVGEINGQENVEEYDEYAGWD